MLTVNPTVGSEVQALCGRCHEPRLHLIVTLEGGKARRVQCRTCDANHLYRAAVVPAKLPAKRKRGEKAPVVLSYEDALKQASERPMVTYLMTSRYLMGQRLKHTTFGDGVVVKVLNPSVIEVVFREGHRKLAIGR